MPFSETRTPARLFGRIKLVHAAIVVVVVGMVVGIALSGQELLEISRMHAQISQIDGFDAAVSDFYDKYHGLPGDLLFVWADREGLPTGDGTPSHSDGDGKISPCNLGWQWNLGCETALFWSHLSGPGFISENFSADNRFTDSRLLNVGLMQPYLPQSPLSEDIYVTVWNTDAAQPSPDPQIPYGNYYEISRISGIAHGRMIDSSRALTPAQARALDDKIDDGMPLKGRVLANGEANWPDDAWGTFAKPGKDNCVSTRKTYNTRNFLTANAPLCHLAIALGCCSGDTQLEQ
jgi:hypothetical protein